MKQVLHYLIYHISLVKKNKMRREIQKRIQVNNIFNLDIIPGGSEGRPVTRSGQKMQNTIQKIGNQKKRADHQIALKKKKL
jgi:hypothetical protein